MRNALKCQTRTPNCANYAAKNCQVNYVKRTSNIATGLQNYKSQPLNDHTPAKPLPGAVFPYSPANI